MTSVGAISATAGETAADDKSGGAISVTAGHGSSTTGSAGGNVAIAGGIGEKETGGAVTVSSGAVWKTFLLPATNICGTDSNEGGPPDATSRLDKVSET